MLRVTNSLSLWVSGQGLVCEEWMCACLALSAEQKLRLIGRTIARS